MPIQLFVSVLEHGQSISFPLESIFVIKISEFPEFPDGVKEGKFPNVTVLKKFPTKMVWKILKRIRVRFFIV